jgi:hypothetical protein
MYTPGHSFAAIRARQLFFDISSQDSPPATRLFRSREKAIRGRESSETARLPSGWQDFFCSAIMLAFSRKRTCAPHLCYAKGLA